jgi:hypothetical protein
MQVTGKTRWTSSDESVCRVEKDRVIATGNGQAVLTAECTLDDGQQVKSTANVTVRKAEVKASWEFNNHVQSVLARAGCNMGACHGALAGKGGFRLSLRGYDSQTDHFHITRQDRGRRIELAQPLESLLLAKPSGALPHQGGLRLVPGSHYYRVLSEWIGSGAAGPRPEDPKLERIEVFPARIQLTPKAKQQFVVRGHYSNGRVEDVTHWCKFSSTDEAVATVDEDGLLTVVGPGESSVNVWFASRIVSARIANHFGYPVDPSAYQQNQVANLVDTHVLEQLRQLRLEPSPVCSDAEFLRRAFLDCVGILPTASETEEFLEDHSPDKRNRLIDALLVRPEFVDYWTYRWSDLLMLNGNLLRPDPLKAYYHWIREHVRRNTPWDQLVREILTARGDSMENGATNFYALHQDPESMTENACQAFLGLSIGCAKCHNHPLEKWTNDQYYSMANLFARVRAKGWGGDARDGDGKRTLVVLDHGDLIQPLTGKPQRPAPLDAPPLDPDSPLDRREALADWLASPDNPYFTRAIVNRVWANFLGIGIINPVDDLRASNPPSNASLMAAMERHLIDNRYDLREMIRLILQSQTYQRSSATTPMNAADRKYFSHYYPKRLMAEVLHDAVCQVTEVPSRFTEIEYSGADKRPTDFYPEGTRALQLYDSAVASTFLKNFGRNQRRITCECERTDEPSVVQVLHLSNGTTLNEKLAKKGSVVDILLDPHGEARSTAQLVDQAYLRSLCRFPSPSERDRLVAELDSSGDPQERRILVEDLLWSLLTSREFLFNH